MPEPRSRHHLETKMNSMPPSLRNIKARSASATALRARNPSNLELTPNQLHCVIHITSLEQLQARLVHDHFRPVTLSYFFLVLENRVFGCVDVFDVDQAHQVLEAVAATRFHCYAQREVWVGVFFCDGFEAMRCAWRDVNGHVVAVVVFARVCDGFGVSLGCD
jgi:hypothetical protein